MIDGYFDVDGLQVTLVDDEHHGALWLRRLIVRRSGGEFAVICPLVPHLGGIRSDVLRVLGDGAVVRRSERLIMWGWARVSLYTWADVREDLAFAGIGLQGAWLSGDNPEGVPLDLWETVSARLRWPAECGELAITRGGFV